MKKLLLLAVVATMAIGMSAQGVSKGKEALRRERVEFKAQGPEQGRFVDRKFHKNDKMRPVVFRKAPGKKLPKCPAKPLPRR